MRVLRSTTRSVYSNATYFKVGRTSAVLATVFSLIVRFSRLQQLSDSRGGESPPDSNIRAAQRALLWAVATLFGSEPVLFGEHHPVTLGGRLITLWLVIISLGLIGSLAGVVSAWIERGSSP